MNYGPLIDAVNAAGLGLFLFVLGALVITLVRRALLYRRAGWSIPLLLRRNLILFGTLTFIIGESILLRVVGGDLFTGDTLLRLVFVLHYDIIVLLAFAYYLKTELQDIEDPKDPDA